MYYNDGAYDYDEDQLIRWLFQVQQFKIGLN